MIYVNLMCIALLGYELGRPPHGWLDIFCLVILTWNILIVGKNCK